MKVVITSGENQFKGNVRNIDAVGEKIEFQFESSPTLTFNKENYNEGRFDFLIGLLRNLNINNNGIWFINVSNGTVTSSNKGDDIKKFNESLQIAPAPGSKIQEPAKLFDGKFTQEPVGAVDKMNKDKYEEIKSTFVPKSY